MSSVRLSTSSLLLGAALALVACRTVPVKGGGASAGKETQAAKTYPVSRRVPATSTYFIAAARLDQGLAAVRDFLRPVGKLEPFADPANLDQALRGEMGFSPLDPADLAEVGLAMDGNVALFGELTPTFALPVADKEKLEAATQRLTQGLPIVVSEVGGTTLRVWRDGDDFLAWAVIDSWVFVHIGNTDVEAPNAWFEAITGDGPKLSHDADLDWARQHARGEQALGLVRWPALAAVVRAKADRADERTPQCDALNGALAAALGRMAIGAELAPGKVQGEMFVEVAPPLLASLTAHVAPAPDAAYRGLAGEAGLAIDLGVDLAWLGRSLAPFDTRDCGEMVELVSELDPADWEDPAAAALGGPTFSSYHLALLGGTLGFGGADIQGVGWFGVIDEGRARQALAQIGPIRAGAAGAVKVEMIDVPGAASPVELSFSGGALKVGMGKGLIAKLTAGGGAAAGPGELFGLAVRPDKVPDLIAALSAFGGDEAAMLARFVSEYRTLGLRAGLGDGGVVFQGGFELR
jgi:hypothetical protein